MNELVPARHSPNDPASERGLRDLDGFRIYILVTRI